MRPSPTQPTGLSKYVQLVCQTVHVPPGWICYWSRDFLSKMASQTAEEEERVRIEERLERLVARCGVASHLVPDTLLLAWKLADQDSTAQQAYLIRSELNDAVGWLVQEPLMSALQDGRATTTTAECRHCPPAGPLRVLHLSRSGSSAEGLADVMMGKGGNSDYDIMLEFGGVFRWAAAPVVAAGEEPGCISPELAPQLWAEPTDSPGFVTLHWARTSRCLHAAPLPAVSADSIRQLVWHQRRMVAQADAEITRSGPATNVCEAGCLHGGIDYVPCFRMPWWPEEDEFLHHPRVTDFPAAAVRRDLCRFGVHLVPTGRPGSNTELAEYRVSFSRAEVVVIRHLSPTQHTTIIAVKGIKNALKDSGASPKLKSYFIKTAVLWLAQDKPSDCWTGITAGVHMVLDWLEHNVSAGSVPCFFWPAIDLVEATGLTTVEIEAIISTIRLMRRRASCLLIACCDSWFADLDTELESWVPEPLSELQLRLKLARLLLRYTVIEAIQYRPSAPCWRSWFSHYIPAVPSLSQHYLLRLRHFSVSCRQHCLLLQALSVAPADLTAGMRLSSLGGDMFAWSATPLLALLTESDLEYVLGDPAAVADWCHRQLCRSPAERPTGLTAELDTPRGRAELLLQPELLLRAVCEAVPTARAAWEKKDQGLAELWQGNFQPLETYQQCRQKLEDTLSCPLQRWLRHDLPELDGPTVDATARHWHQRLQHLLSGDRLHAEYTDVTTRRADRWELRQYAMLDPPTEGKTRRRAGEARWCRCYNSADDGH